MNNENKNFCRNCRFLSLTEEEQQKQKRNKEDHICKLFNRRIFHGRWHPELCRLPECFDMENNKNHIYTAICEECNGIGIKVSSDFKKKTCEICKGSGYVNIKCNKCGNIINLTEEAKLCSSEKNLPNSKIVSNLVLFKNNKATFLENVRIEFNNDGLFCENEKDDCGNFINFKYVSRCFSIGDTFYLFYKE